MTRTRDSRPVPNCAHGRKRDGPERTYVIESAREHSGRLLVRLAGVSDRDAADALRGTVFVVDSEELPPIDDPDEFYDHQLEGLRVRDDRRAAPSATSRRFCTPRQANCLSVRVDDDDGGEVLVPFVSAIVNDGIARGPDHRDRPARGSSGAGLTHAYRRGDNLPGYLDPLRAIVARQGD